MSTFKFKKEVEVYFAPIDSLSGSSTTSVKLDLSEISFSQTFTDKTYSTRTLHNRNNLFEQSNIKSANPADFSMDLNVIEGSDFLKVYEHLLDLDSEGQLKKFHLYIFFKSTNDRSFKVENCVFTSGSFIIEKNKPLTLSLKGQGSKVTVNGVTSTGFVKSGVGSISTTRSSTVTHIMNNYVSCTIDGNTTTGVQAIKVELQNQIKWTPYKTLNGALNVDSYSSSQFPTKSRLEKRILSGAIKIYTGSEVVSSSANFPQSWEEGVSINIRAGKNSTTGFQFIMTNGCTYTNRAELNDVLSETFDWKWNTNVANLSNIIRINNLT